jgi:hypothetical protein
MAEGGLHGGIENTASPAPGTISGSVNFDQPTVVLSGLVGIQSSETLLVQQQIPFYVVPNGV